MNIDSSPNELQLQALRQRLEPASTKTPLKSATQDFEGMFISYLMKVMRSTVDTSEDGELSLGKDLYTELFDNEIALNIARNRSLGIGDMIYRQLKESGHETATPSPAVKPADAPQPQPTEEAIPSPEALSMPVSGRVTSDFGLRVDPMQGSPEFHKGIDIAAPAGTPFKAAANGTVVFAGVLGGYGNTVILEHAGGERTLYGHASQILVRTGDQVSADQPIGLVGSTGRSTGPHLHFEAVVGSQNVDPKILLAMKVSGNVQTDSQR